jgi:hypothetical protein
MWIPEKIEKQNIDYLSSKIFTPNGELNILPYSYYDSIEPVHIRQFCLENGIYCLPTQELIDYLKQETKDRKTIEIGAGHGSICKALGIVGTDSYLQEREDMKREYSLIQQPTVQYGKHVEKLEAEEAVRKYKPDTVLAAWVTHKYEPKKHYNEGNMWGIRENKILEKCNRYIFVGNISPHRKKIILDIPHKTIEPNWLVSRIFKKQGCKDVIWIWEQN